MIIQRKHKEKECKSSTWFKFESRVFLIPLTAKNFSHYALERTYVYTTSLRTYFVSLPHIVYSLCNAVHFVCTAKTVCFVNLVFFYCFRHHYVYIVLII